MHQLIKVLTEKGKSISTCESFTGGLMATKLCSFAGASRVYAGSIIAYSSQSKVDLVHVDPQLIQQYGTISPQVVAQMAEKTRLLFHTDYALAFSGNAGPTLLENKPCGLWYGALACSDQTIVFGGISNLDRNSLREAAVATGIKVVLDQIRNN